MVKWIYVWAWEAEKTSKTKWELNCGTPCNHIWNITLYKCVFGSLMSFFILLNNCNCNWRKILIIINHVKHNFAQGYYFPITNKSTEASQNVSTRLFVHFPWFKVFKYFLSLFDSLLCKHVPTWCLQHRKHLFNFIFTTAQQCYKMYWTRIPWFRGYIKDVGTFCQPLL